MKGSTNVELVTEHLEFFFHTRDVGIIDEGSLTLLRDYAYPQTYEACVRGGISLSFRTYASPYFGALAESRTFVG